MWRLIFSQLFNLILPPRPTERVVASISTENLISLKKLSTHTDGASLPYQHKVVTALVWELKYYANPTAAHLAGASLQEELLAIAAEELGNLLLIPVPMHRTRRKKRGRNQTETLCKAALYGLGDVYTYTPSVLTRTRNTPPQQGLSRDKRLTNVHNSMQVIDLSMVKDRVCVVVDDVSTTGATLHEAKRALLEAGASKVLCVSLAVAL